MQKNQSRLSITHINTTDSQGGAAKSTWRLTEAQRKAGHEAARLVGYKNTDSPTSFSFSLDVDAALHTHCIQQGLQYYQFQGSYRLLQHPQVANTDVLHFQNLHGDYFNPFSISLLSQMKPVVWTLRDMHAITGHCGYSLDCEKWKTGCGECPYLSNYPEILTDATARMWQDKSLIYTHSNLHIVTPSMWLKKMVEASILKHHPVDLIYNGTNTSVFKPYNKKEVRKKFNIPDHVPVIGAVAQGSALGNPYKGGKYTLDALNELRSLIPDFVFVNVGADFPSKDPHILNFPYIEDETELAQVYSALDFFLFTTLADNCPLVVIEAMSCGIPLATFDTGGVPELVRDGIDGLVTPYKDIDAIVRSAYRLAKDSAFREQCSRNARQRALELYDMQRVASNYETLYRNRIDTFQKSQAANVRLFPSAQVPVEIRTPAFFQAEQIKQRWLQQHTKETGTSGIRSEQETDFIPSRAVVPQKSRISFSEILQKQDEKENERKPEIRVSAIVSTYNSEQFIRGCLQDLLDQTLRDHLEIIVIDSGSQQNEAAIVAEFQKLAPEIHYLRTEQRESIYAAWNRGIKAARGKYITNANTDDRRRKDAFEIMARNLDTNPQIALVYADQLYTQIPNETFDGTASTIRRVWSPYSYETLRSHCMVGPQPMWRRSLHERYGYFDETYFSAGDWEFWLRIGQNETFLKIDDVLGLYYVNPHGLENVHPSTASEVERIHRSYHISPLEQRQPTFAPYEKKRMVSTGFPVRPKAEKLVLLLQIDGLSRRHAVEMPFLKNLMNENACGGYRPTLNRVTRPSMFGGVSAAEYGYVFPMIYAPSSSPFHLAAGLPQTLEPPSALLRSKVNSFIQDFVTGERITPYAAAQLARYDLPPDYLPFFDIAEKRAPWDKDPGYISLFHRLKSKGKEWFQNANLYMPGNRTEDDRTLLNSALDALTDNTKFVYLQLCDILHAGQRSGPESEAFKQTLRQTDELISSFIQILNQKYGSRLEFILFSEFGLLPVEERIDIQAMLKRSSLNWGHDYVCFLEPDLARFWFQTVRARTLISKSLGRLKKGEIQKESELHPSELGSFKRCNADLIYLPRPGILIDPHFTKINGLPLQSARNQLRTESEDEGVFLLSCVSCTLEANSNHQIDASGIYHLLLELLDIHSGV